MKKSILVVLFLFTQVLAGYCQQGADNINAKNVAISEDNSVAKTASAMPAYPGGDRAFHKFINKNIKYPAAAREQKTEGQVTVRFMVDADGTVKNAKIPEGKGIGNGCDEEAVRVVMSSPNWKPGMRAGNPTAMWYEIPITFSLSQIR